jgi:hypothetical protein
MPIHSKGVLITSKSMHQSPYGALNGQFAGG